ncbi:MAG: DUF5330 domain-containing protein [Alphaproteobacteria bacterium]
MFLIRTAFWLSLVILLIPGNPDTGQDAPRVGALQALSAMQATFTDMTGFCDRNPAVCTTGEAAFRVFGDKARNGARMIYDYFGDSPEDIDIDRGTLRDDDLQPGWQGDALDERPA